MPTDAYGILPMAPATPTVVWIGVGAIAVMLIGFGYLAWLMSPDD
jgi:hypothetical protein